MSEPLTLRFHKSLYDGGAVRRASERFTALGAMEVVEADMDWLVVATPVRESIRERLGDELQNHALFESILVRKGMSA